MLQHLATSGLGLLPSGGGMCTASSTVREESWRACVIWPSRVEQSSFSTDFDATGGRNCFVWRFVNCRCRSTICCGCTQTICTCRSGWEYCAACINSSGVLMNPYLNWSFPMLSRSRSMSSMTVTCSSMDTWAAGGSVDHGMATNKAHRPVPVIWVKFGRSRGWR